MVTDLTVSNELMSALAALEETTARQAKENLKGLKLTTLQRQTAILFEQLRLINGPVDYSRERLKGEILAQLDAGDFWQYHPSSPASLDELLMSIGMSKSERSDLLVWERTLYPFLERELELHPYEIWTMLGKTKMRRVTGFLRQLADPKWNSSSSKVHEVVRKLKEEVGEVPDENLAAVRRLLEIAQSMTSQDLEETISGEPTPAIEMDGTRHQVIIIDGETGEIISEQVRYKVTFWASQDQLTLLQRRFPNRLSLMIEAGDDIKEVFQG